MVEVARVELGEVFHLTAPRWKHEENSQRGVLEAVQGHFPSIDIDTQWNRTRPLATHWLHPMLHDDFIDPEHRINPYTPITNLDDAQVDRLVTRTGGYPILGARHLVQFAVDNGRKVRLEVKGGTAYRWTLAALAAIHDWVPDAPRHVVIATMSTYPGWHRVLVDAHTAGFDTRDLGNG